MVALYQRHPHLQAPAWSWHHSDGVAACKLSAGPVGVRHRKVHWSRRVDLLAPCTGEPRWRCTHPVPCCTGRCPPHRQTDCWEGSMVEGAVDDELGQDDQGAGGLRLECSPS